jgi:hypothetical protein
MGALPRSFLLRGTRLLVGERLSNRILLRAHDKHHPGLVLIGNGANPYATICKLAKTDVDAVSMFTHRNAQQHLLAQALCARSATMITQVEGALNFYSLTPCR